MDTKTIRLTRNLVLQALEAEEVMKFRSGAWATLGDKMSQAGTKTPVAQSDCWVCAVGAVMSHVLDSPITSQVERACLTGTSEVLSSCLDPHDAVEQYLEEDVLDVHLLQAIEVENALYDVAKEVVEDNPLTALSQYFEGLSQYYHPDARHAPMELREKRKALILEFVKNEFPEEFFVEIPEEFPLSPKALEIQTSA